MTSAPCVAQLRAFLHEVSFFPLSQPVLPALLEQVSLRRSARAFHLVPWLKFRASISTLASPHWVLALPPSCLKVPEELLEPHLGLALMVA